MLSRCALRYLRYGREWLSSNGGRSIGPVFVPADATGGTGSVPPQSVIEWAGLGDFPNPYVYLDEYDLEKYAEIADLDVEELKAYHSLAEMNDHGLSFEHIADIIEKYL